MRLSCTCFILSISMIITTLPLVVHAGMDDDKTQQSSSLNPTDKSAPQKISNHSPSRRPASYIGGSINYAQTRSWIKANDDHDDLSYGPLHSLGYSFRVGDAFADWFALGFQIEIINAKNNTTKVGAFNLMLDISIYPWKGLGIRPSVGMGMGFTMGENDWELGTGGPGCLSLAVLYEFSITKLFSIAPVAQAFWITGGEFDGLFIFFGLEFTKWFLPEDD